MFRSAITIFGSITTIFGFLLTMLLFILGIKDPILAKKLLMTMVVIGIPLTTFALVGARRFDGILDYEPTTFLGRPTNGKKVRSIFRSLLIVGLWLCLPAIYFLIVI